MANVLNRATTLAKIREYLKSATDTNAKYGISFTDDGHLIHNGIDYFAINAVDATDTQIALGYNLALAAVVSNAVSTGTASKVAHALTLQFNGNTQATYDGSAAKTFNVTPAGIGAASLTDGKVTWSQLPITTAYSTVLSADDKTLMSTYQVQLYVSELKTQAMVFKGTVAGVSLDGGTGLVNMDTTYSTARQGDTYKVSTAGWVTINNTSTYFEVGDTIICLSNGGTAPVWTVLQNNIDTKVLKVNGSDYTIYTTSSSLPTIFGPTSVGTSGLFLVSQGEGKAPTWATPSTLTVGTASVANKLANALTISTGLLGTSYDGSSSVTISLKVASSKTLGGVLPYKSYDSTYTLGSNNTINASTTTAGRYYAVETDNVGHLFVNVPWANDNTTYTFSKGDGLTLSLSGTSITYGVDLVSLDTLTGAIGSSDIIAVRLDNNKKLAVSAADYIKTLVFTSSTGTNNAATTGTVYLKGTNASGVKSSVRITGSGYTSVSSDGNGILTISSSTRTVSVNGSTLTNSLPINFLNGESVYAVLNSVTNDSGLVVSYNVGFDLRWYDVDQGKYIDM